MSGFVFVYLCCPDVVMVVFWSVFLICDVDEGVDFGADSEDVEVGDVEDVEFFHEWCGVCSWW